MDKISKLQQMFEYAKQKSICKTKQEFAKHIGIANSNLSSAFNGDTRYLNDNLLKRINESLENVFSLEWLMYGTGDMYAQAQATATAEISSVVTPRTTAAEDKPKISLIDHLEYTIEVQKKLIEKLEKENDALKKANTHASASVKHA